MRIKILKAINLLALLLSVAWMATNPDWDSAISTVGLIATMIGLEVRQEQTRIQHPDIQLFRKFLAALPSDGDMYYVSHEDMGGPIDMDQLNQLRRFKYDWNNAEHEFIDRDLESKRKILRNLIEEFYSYLGQTTWQVKDTRFQRVPQEWQYEQPERFRQAVDRLNSHADEIFHLHQDLVRTGKKKLHIATIA